MKIKKCLKVSLICSAILSVILYGTIFFQSISVLEFQYAQIFLFSAETLTILTVIFIICLVIISKDISALSKIKKVIICSVSVCITLCVFFTGYGLLSCYNNYTPENIIKNDKLYIQRFMPYHNIIDDKNENTDLMVSYIPGTHYVFLNCYGTSSFGIPLDYEVEYFKSVSPFLNMKFNFERMFLSPLSEFDLDVLVPGKDMEIDGVKLTIYVDDNDYAVLIKSFGQSIYASLINASNKVSEEEFAREIIKQFELLDNVTKEKVFLDIPLSEAF